MRKPRFTYKAECERLVTEINARLKQYGAKYYVDSGQNENGHFLTYYRKNGEWFRTSSRVGWTHEHMSRYLKGYLDCLCWNLEQN